MVGFRLDKGFHRFIHFGCNSGRLWYVSYLIFLDYTLHNDTDKSTWKTYLGESSAFNENSLDISQFTLCGSLVEETCICETPVVSRYVAIVATGTTALSLCYVKVYQRSGW